MSTANPSQPDAPSEPDAAPESNGQAGVPLFPVVAIGASAGGLEAITQLLGTLTEDTGMAFVVVQHLDPSHESHLRDLLSRATPLPVTEATHGLRLQPNNVYIIPRNASMSVAAGVLQLAAPRAEGRGPHLAIDKFFGSLAEDRQADAIGVVLSGTGTDGTLGVEEIKAAGGFALAQDEASAKYPSMPQSAIRSGCIDLVLPPDGIADALGRIARHPLLAPLEAARQGTVVGDELIYRDIMETLRDATGVDFTDYRETTIRRRILRRAVLRNGESLEGYAASLKGDRDEVEALYHDILINVTSFFRDPETFEALKEVVFPEIVKGRDANVPIRAWVAGCSTGQEAYSLAIALLEFLDGRASRPAIQIFATDLSDAVSLRRAREGIYPKSIEHQVGAERLHRYFTKVDEHYRVNKPIRDMCVFAKQNVAADPPFSRVDLVTCRNLLIYLGETLQKRVIPTFHYALNSPGFLLLGPSETIGNSGDLFTVVDHRHRIYRKKPVAARPHPLYSTEVFRRSFGGPRSLPSSPPPRADLQREADRMLLGQFAPPGVLVSDDLEILQFRGETGPYLRPAPGEPSFNLMRMAREGLFPVLRDAIEECGRTGAPTSRENVSVRGEDRPRRIDLRVLAVKPAGSAVSCFLVLFVPIDGRPAPGEPRPETRTTPGLLRRLLGREPTGGRPGAAVEGSPQPDSGAVERLGAELASTRDYLESAFERYDVTNEELRSANEEILSSNEELQSTNEELETAKEELQSVNEELITANEQLRQSNQEQARLNDDLANLLDSAEVAMFALGHDRKIRRFTQAAAKLLGLEAGDIGRPFGHVKLPIHVPDFDALIAGVVETSRPAAREIRDPSGRWLTLRIQPYRTAEGANEGVVVVLIDISEIKGAGARLREALDYTRVVVETVREPLLVLDNAMSVRSANRAFYQTFQLSPEETEGRKVFELNHGEWDIPRLRGLLEEVVPRGSAVEDFEISHQFATLGQKDLLLNARRMVLDVEGPELTLLAIEDVTGLTQAEKSLGRSEERMRLLLDNVTDYAVYFIDPSGRVVGWDEGAARAFGYRTEEIVGRDASLLFLAEDVAKGLPRTELETATKEGRASDDNWLLRKDGSRFWASGATTALRDEAGGLRGFVKIVRDQTETRRAKEALAESEQRLRAALSAAQMGTWHWQIPLDRQALDESLARIFGIPPNEAVRPLDGFLALIHPDDRDAVATAFDRSVREGVGLDVDFRVPRPDGTVRWLKDQGEVFRDERGKPRYMTGACVDITLRKQYEEELRQARDELDRRVRERTAELLAANATLEEQFAERRGLLLRLASTEEHERSRISRELHDEMGQYLTALILELKLLGDSLPEDSSARDRVEHLKQITSDVGGEVHRIAVELRPTALDDVGLETTLQNYLDEWSARTGTRVDFHGSGAGPRASSAAETTLYRIAREALTNVAKHAGATRVGVILEVRDDHASLIVEDNGDGFDVEEVLNTRGPSAKLGLLGMRERVAMIDGTLNIESAAGGPTTIFVRLPLNRNPEGEPRG